VTNGIEQLLGCLTFVAVIIHQLL